MPAKSRTPAFDDVDVPTTAPVAPAPQPVVPPRTQVAVPQTPPVRVSDFASQLASQLVGKDETDTGGGPAIPLGALLGSNRPVDPELDPVGIGPQIPRYLANALRLAAFASGVQQKQIVADGLKAVLPAELVDQAYREEAARRNPR